MRLIAILLSLWANRYPEQVDRWRRPDGFFRYAAWIDARCAGARLDDGLSCFLAVLLPPVLLMAALQWLAADALLGLGELILGLWALLFAHGPGQVDRRLEEFVDGWRQGRPERAREALAELAAGPLPEDDAALPRAAVEALFWRSYRQLYGGLFWLLLLGPVGPVLLRSAELTREYAARREEPAMAHFAGAFLHALDWLPARATALAFGLAGSFVHAIEAWRAAREEPDVQPRHIVVHAGLGALSPEEPESEAVEELVEDARALVSRALLVWLSATAVLTIAGWLY